MGASRPKQTSQPRAAVVTLDSSLVEAVLTAVREGAKRIDDRFDSEAVRVEARHEENRKSRHDFADRMETRFAGQDMEYRALEARVASMASDVTVVQNRLLAIDGGPQGGGGVLKRIEQGQEKAEQSQEKMADALAALASDVRSLREARTQDPRVEALTTRVDLLQTAQNQWSGVYKAVTILSGIIALIVGLAAVFHLMHR